MPQKIHKTDLNPSDNHINKSIFKDKKLNKLWEKAEKSGFDQKELKTLKEEFEHYQDKIDEYYSLLETLNADDKKSKRPLLCYQQFFKKIHTFNKWIFTQIYTCNP